MSIQNQSILFKKTHFHGTTKPFLFIQRLLQFYFTVPPMITFHKLYIYSQQYYFLSTASAAALIMVQWWFRACAGGASLVAWSFCSPLLCSTAGDSLGGRLSVRPSVWDAVWGRATRVVLGVSGVCVSGACSRGSSSSSSSSSTTCCVLLLLFGWRYCMDGWVGGCDRGW